MSGVQEESFVGLGVDHYADHVNFLSCAGSLKMLLQFIEVKLMVKRYLIPTATIEEDHHLFRIAFVPTEVGIHALAGEFLHCFVFFITVEGSMSGEEGIESGVDCCAGAH